MLWQIILQYRIPYMLWRKIIFGRVKTPLAVVTNLSITILKYVAMVDLVHWWKATVHIAVVLCLTVITVKCCDDNVLDLQNSCNTCCGNVLYDPSTQACCNGGLR